MVSSKFIATLAAAFAFSGVQATPVAVTPRSATCSYSPLDASLSCGRGGYLLPNSPELSKHSITASTAEECASACYDLGPCYVFTYSDSGSCRFFIQYMRDANDFMFTDLTPETNYYDIDCFSCV
ncbi:hypothetical protein B0J13DRAFT_557498 [Dactylonectria estremocensis]|uniref:Apple domain-containing protein n=1 Tax=Dactylonectria estremocensis TaxID=1079267 RepID=A0A9P9ENJ9_9HYPO|nr:hypothetical protein B0J13DRAFT_557498 [Dactylonectria estremocensis]